MDDQKKRFLKISGFVLAAVLLIEGMGYLLGWRASRIAATAQTKPRPGLSNLLKSENSLLRTKIDSLRPCGLYIVVDTANNLLYLKEGNRTLLKTTISAGSGSILNDPSGQRKWVFETPRGELAVQSKFVKPTWIKPDWAFVEEGKAIPKSITER